MAHTLTITYGQGASETTVTLTLVNYTPTSAPASQAQVTESWEVYVSGASKALLQAEIEKINKAFELARQHAANPFQAHVWLNFQPADYASSYRSEILDGQIIYYDESLKWAWADNAFDVKLVITRRNWWEGAEASIPLSNSNGTDVSDGLDVYNNNDGTGASPAVQENYADIDADDLAGDLPAPLKLKFTSTGALEDLIVCLNRSGAASTLVHMAEGEDAAEIDGTYSDGNCSGGYYGYENFTAVNLPATVIRFNSTVWTDLERGRWYLPLMRLSTVPTISDLWTQAYVDTGGVIYQTQWISYPAADGPQVIQYPPVRLGLPGWSSGYYKVWFRFKTSTSGTKTIYCDYCYMLPLDGVRFYTVSLTAGYIQDDPYDELIYKYETGTSRQSLLVVRGKPLMVDPRHDTRIYLLSPGDTADIDVHIDLEADYRPRRLAL